jgi:hypothetical protein
MSRWKSISLVIVAGLLFLTHSTIPANAWNQSTFAAQAYGGGGFETTVGIATDAGGNIYSTGTLAGAIDVDPSPTSTATLSQVGGGVDIWITKFNSSGDYIWGKAFGGTDGDVPYGIDVDSNGNVFVVGTYAGTVDFDPGAGTTSRTSRGNNDNFVVKLTTDGNFAWVKEFGGANEERATGVVLDSNNNILVTGLFNDNVDFNPAPLETNTVTGNYADGFVLKLDPNGGYLWAKGFGGSSADYGEGIAVDSNNNVYVTGRYTGNVDFDPGAGITTIAGSATNGAFILKLNSDGNFGFARGFDGTGQDVGLEIEVDSGGNILTAGQFQSTVDFDPGAGTANLTTSPSSAIFLLKLDPSGNYLWAKSWGGSGDLPWDLKITLSNDVLLSGDYLGTVDFDPNAGVSSYTAQNSTDGFILKLDTSGNFVWVSTLRGDQSQQPRVMELISGGYILVAGVFYQIDFNPSVSVALIANSSNGSDLFLMRLASDGSLSPANLIDKAIFASLGISGGGTVATFRSSTSLAAEVNVAARVSFLSNGKFISGCRNLLATGSGTSFTATCTWKPSVRGSAVITAVAVPTTAGISSGVSSPLGTVVRNRTTLR